MIFLGLASNLSAGQVIGQLFAFGTKRSSNQLKANLASRYHSVPNRTALYHTGRSALAAAFRTVGSRSGKVIIPGLTCIAVVRAIRAAGYEPIYADIDPETLQYDWPKLRSLLESCPDSTDSTKNLAENSRNRGFRRSSIDKKKNLCYNGSIIVAQNTLGLPLDMQKLEQLADEFDLKIVEDLAHCAGRFYSDDREVGTVGAATVLSFGKGKALDTSEGGALILRDQLLSMPTLPSKRPALSDTMRDRWYPVFGAMIRGCYYLGLGKLLTAFFVKTHLIAKSADAKLDEDTRLTHWQAKLARKQLKNLPRTPLREFYLVHDREELLKKLSAKGYYLHEIWYDTPVSPARYLEEADFPENSCPRTVQVAESIINLPTWYSDKHLQPVRDLTKPYILEETNGN